MTTAILASLILPGSMPQANYRAKSDLPNDTAFGGFAPSSNTSWSLLDVNIKTDGLNLVIKKNACCGTKKNECPLIVALANGTEKEIWFTAQDSRIDLGREARDESGNWKPIEFRAPSECGNSYHKVALGPGRVWTWDVPNTSGAFTTKCRYVLTGLTKPVTSDEFDVNLDPSVFSLPGGWETYKLMPDGRLSMKS